MDQSKNGWLSAYFAVNLLFWVKVNLLNRGQQVSLSNLGPPMYSSLDSCCSQTPQSWISSQSTLLPSGMQQSNQNKNSPSNAPSSPPIYLILCIQLFILSLQSSLFSKFDRSSCSQTKMESSWISTSSIIYHSCQDQSSWPTINSIVVIKVSENKFGSSIIEGTYVFIILFARNVVVTESEIDELQRFMLLTN